MLFKFRENLYLGDKDAYKSVDELKEKGITAIMIVADDLNTPEFATNTDIRVIKIGLRMDRMNPTHIKDLATHCPKYMCQYGEVVLVQGVTGLQRAAFIACRLLCELEGKTVYEIMTELKKELPEFEINKSYF